MVNFVKPNLLGTITEFTNRFANPIKNGQCRDSTPYDVRMMKQRAHILHELLLGTVQVKEMTCSYPFSSTFLSLSLSLSFSLCLYVCVCERERKGLLCTCMDTCPGVIL